RAADHWRARCSHHDLLETAGYQKRASNGGTSRSRAVPASCAAGVLRPFARGPGGYSTALGPEPYITMAGNDRVAGTGCSFRSGMIFALQPGGRPGIILIGADGR